MNLEGTSKITPNSALNANRGQSPSSHSQASIFVLLTYLKHSSGFSYSEIPLRNEYDK